MGGRLDATNIVDPLLSVITDISLDHTEWLGSTIAAIAREKAGILRRNGTLITLPQHPEANQVLGEVAIELEVRGVSAAPICRRLRRHAGGPIPFEALSATIHVDSPLTGAHQHRNVALAIAAAVELATTHKLPASRPPASPTGIRQTHWPARLERIEQDGSRMDSRCCAQSRRRLGPACRPESAFCAADRQGRTYSSSVACATSPSRRWRRFCFRFSTRSSFAPIHAHAQPRLADLLAAAEDHGNTGRWRRFGGPSHAACQSNGRKADLSSSPGRYIWSARRVLCCSAAGKAELAAMSRRVPIRCRGSIAGAQTCFKSLS